MVGCGEVRYGRVGQGMANGCGKVRSGIVWYGLVGSGTVWLGKAWYGSVWQCRVWLLNKNTLYLTKVKKFSFGFFGVYLPARLQSLAGFLLWAIKKPPPLLAGAKDNKSNR